MFVAEVSGSWFDMGRQVGQSYRRPLRHMLRRFLAFLPREQRRVNPAVARLRAAVLRHAPELMEETEGMARGAGIEPETLFRYRFYVDLKASFETGCTAFAATGSGGDLWLGRTCDIEREDHPYQLCLIRRPTGGIATIVTTYLGMAISVGMNAHGLGLVGVSGPGVPRPCADAFPVSLAYHRALMDARTVREARQVLSPKPLTGKGSLMIAGDDTGQQALFEMSPGRRAIVTFGDPGRPWMACANFYRSPHLSHRPDTPYLYNAYARYGRLVHCFETHPPVWLKGELQRLLADISQPGPYIPEGACRLETAYATLFDLRRRAVYLADGNPNVRPFRMLKL